MINTKRIYAPTRGRWIFCFEEMYAKELKKIVFHQFLQHFFCLGRARAESSGLAIANPVQLHVVPPCNSLLGRKTDCGSAPWSPRGREDSHAALFPAMIMTGDLTQRKPFSVCPPRIVSLGVV